MLAGLVEPMRIVDDHQLGQAAAHLLVGVGDVALQIVGDVALLGHDDDAWVARAVSPRR